jgi:Leucine Rich repeats (2 copies)
MLTAQEYLNNNYKDKTITELNLSGWNEVSWTAKPNWEKLTGTLDLSDFPNLEKLNCSYNKITSLNLTNCPNLTELKCWENKLTEIKFPKHLNLKTFYAWTNYLTEIDWKAFNPHNLTNISISNNDLQDKDIEIFNKFTNLEELYLGTDIVSRLEERKYNRFHGSLKKLVEGCKQLKKLQIEGTGIEEDLKHLPKDLEITSWHKQNEMIAKIIPLERLYVIRGNLKQFFTKWAKKDKDNQTELSKLQSPDQYSKFRYLGGVKWIARSVAVTGGILALTDNPVVGGSLAAASPLIDTIASQIEEDYYLKREDKWKEFLVDADTFLDNYNELSGMLSQFEKSSKLKGKVNKAIGDLSEKIKGFLNIYDGAWDEKKDGEIDINELTTRRDELIKDLNKGKDSEVQGMVDTIKELEKAIIEYRKFSYYEETVEKKDNKQETNDNQQKDESLEKEKEDEIEVHVEQPPKRVSTF